MTLGSMFWFLLGITVQRVSQVYGANGCEIEFPGPFRPMWWEAELHNIQFTMDFHIIGLRDVSKSGKSFGVDVEIWRRWKDKRLVEGDQNKHRETECPSNDIIDWGVYAPGDLQIVQTKAKESRDWTGFKFYSAKGGMFEFVYRSYVKIECDMDFTFYPFDTQDCAFEMKSLDKNMTYETYSTNIIFDQDILHMDMFDVSFTPLKNTTQILNTEEYSLTGFVVTMKRSPTPFYINIYLPTGLLTIASLIGFIIPVGAEEGRRMALLVTVFLMLVNISSTERNRGPATRTMTCMDIWMLLCILLVFFAMLEYAVVLVIGFREKVDPQKRNKIDYWALWVFMGLEFLTACTYFYCVSSYA